MKHFSRLIITLILILSPTVIFAQDPGIRDTVRIGDVEVSPGCPVGVPITAYTDEGLVGASIGISWGSTLLNLDSVSFVGSALEGYSVGERPLSIDNSNSRALIGLAIFNAVDTTHPGDTLWATCWFTADPIAGPQVIVIDSAFFPPAGEFIFVETNQVEFTPKFIEGSITILALVDSDLDGIDDACDICPDDPDNDIDQDGYCAGDDNCPTRYNPLQEDGDGDGVGDICDNCPEFSNADQSDPDSDLTGEDCDNCPGTYNPVQFDDDDDGLGNECDACPDDPDNDVDSDGICASVDNCPGTSNSGQTDSDGDGIGDACDSCPDDPQNDIDGDGVCGDVDICPTTPDINQMDSDFDGIGDACDDCPNDPDNDIDGDGVCGDIDICPSVANSDQVDTDGDGFGDVCDGCPTDPTNSSPGDADSDGFGDLCDNCPSDVNPSQEESDGDGIGDACDACPNDPNNDSDIDGVCGDIDNCPNDPNGGQVDSDGDGIGDACDECPNDSDNDIDGDGLCGDVDPCPLDPLNDEDGDGLCGDVDNCPQVNNASQDDSDNDSVGDLCDNCPDIPNPDQADSDSPPDGLGDACFLPQTLWPLVLTAGAGNVGGGGSPASFGSMPPDAHVNLFLFDPVGDSIGATPEDIIVTSYLNGGAEYTSINGEDQITIDSVRTGVYRFAVIGTKDASIEPDAGYTLTIRTDGTVEAQITPITAVPAAGETDFSGYRTIPYIFGDSNGDARINISDATFIIAYIFSGGGSPEPIAAGDANCSGRVSIVDATFIIAFIFSGGVAPGCG